MNAKNVPNNLTAVIMAGGAGTRFWPVSTERRPKQFLSLLGERTLLQQSYDRVAGLLPAARIFVLTAERFVDLVVEQLPELPAENIIGEPMRRDTGAAVALAALLVKKRHGDDALMTVLTSDHRIEPIGVFEADLLAAVRGAAADRTALYTFGIAPSYAATGYGYLQRGEALTDCAGAETESYRLQRFVEKPDQKTAESYVKDGSYYWNSGMFVWSIEAIVAELERHLPDHVARLSQAMLADRTDGWSSALAAAFEPLEPISIDFGVMEKAATVCCAVARFQWSDVGGWLALEAFMESDSAENCARGELHTLDAKRNLLFAEDEDEHVALIGVEGLVVVRSKNRTLIVPRERAEDVKTLVKTLNDELR